MEKVSLLGSKEDDPYDYFSCIISKKPGSGLHTSFWDEPWVESIPLKIMSHRLFIISKPRDRIVGGVDARENDVMVWDLKWQRSFFVHELEWIANLFSIIQE